MRGIADYGMYKEFSIEEVKSLIENAERLKGRNERNKKYTHFVFDRSFNNNDFNRSAPCLDILFVFLSRHP